MLHKTHENHTTNANNIQTYHSAQPSLSRLAWEHTLPEMKLTPCYHFYKNMLTFLHGPTPTCRGSTLFEPLEGAQVGLIEVKMIPSGASTNYKMQSGKTLSGRVH